MVEWASNGRLCSYSLDALARTISAEGGQMMTTQDAIKTLRELWRETNDPWYEETYDKAISALEKQIPKKPIRNVGLINPAWVEDADLCPICFNWVGLFGFCSRCGQKLDWEEDNDKYDISKSKV